MNSVLQTAFCALLLGLLTPILCAQQQAVERFELQPAIEASTIHAAPSDSADTPDEWLTVLSWNIKMLPRITFIEPPRARAKALAKKLAQLDYDVLLLQESFNAQGRRKMLRGLRDNYPHRVGPANYRFFSIKTNSGLWVLSKYPVKEVDEIQFSEFANFDNKMARKGALMVEVDWNGKPVHFIVTHQNAGGPLDLRLRQSAEIKHQLMERYSTDSIPLFVAGDFNINGRPNGGLEPLVDTLGLPYQHPTNWGDSRHGVDYIFYDLKNHSDWGVEIRKHRYRGSWKNNGVKPGVGHWLSDHPAISAHIHVRDFKPYPKLK